MRLCQLLSNIAQMNFKRNDLFYYEDADLEKGIELWEKLFMPNESDVAKGNKHE